MAHETRVFVVDARAAAELERRLRDELPAHAEWRPAPHARFQVKAEGFVATCYTSGKLVVQGSDLDAFENRFLHAGTKRSTGAKDRPDDIDLPLDRPTIGSDEAGKGDYFGPLVVAAVFVTPAQTAELGKLGVRDSKTLTDDRARLLAGRIEELCDAEAIALQPTDYNAAWEKVRNVNVLLGSLHARAIKALTLRHADAARIVVDKFGDDAYVGKALRKEEVPALEVIQVPRAERNLAVAAASIVARAAFLDGLAACSDACGTDLHKGAGEPTESPARRVVQIGGRDLLGKVAKLHFKNTMRIPGL
ncbi:MAG: ribonuclease HIII [Planctomycetota bacterium]